MKLSSLTSDTVYVPELSSANIDVAPGKEGGKSNYQASSTTSKSSAGPPGTKQPQPKAGGSKKFDHPRADHPQRQRPRRSLGAPGPRGPRPGSSADPGDQAQRYRARPEPSRGTGVTSGNSRASSCRRSFPPPSRGGLPADIVGDLKGQLGEVADSPGRRRQAGAQQIAARPSSSRKRPSRSAKTCRRKSRRDSEAVRGRRRTSSRGSSPRRRQEEVTEPLFAALRNQCALCPRRTISRRKAGVK